MLFSTNLLKQYISLDIAPKDLMSAMTLHACEIEHMSERKLPDLVVIGRVLSTTKHPNADTLTICQLDCGSHGIYQICTAAENIKPEIFVPVALPGSYLPAIDLTIAERKMRGEDSNGMICAKVELGIDEDADQHGIWIMDEDFSDLNKTDLGTSLSTKYPRLENTILDVDNKTINNRPDLTGLLGMAIEMKAIFSNLASSGGATTKDPGQQKDNGILNGLDTFPQEDLLRSALRSVGHIKHQNITHILSEHSPARSLELLNHATKSPQQIDRQTDKCSLYMMLELDNISVRRSPLYDRLSMIDSGLSPKNNRVDFSNLVATILGQPVHCFDADQIHGTITVRQANDGEQFTDLKGTTHTLKSQDIVIADDKEILALAGVIGGQKSGVSDTTKRILIEIANFDPVAVRRTSMRIGVRTDAVSRFEKTISPCLTLTAFSLILDLLRQYNIMLGDYTITGSNYDIDDQTATEAMHGKYIDFDKERCKQLIWGNSTEIAKENYDDQINNILHSLGFQGQDKTVRIPRRRGPDDMNIAEDIYEEVARLYGYNRIQTLPTIDTIEYVPFEGIVKINRIVEDTLVNRYALDQIQTYPRCDEMFFDLLSPLGLSHPLDKGGLGGFEGDGGGFPNLVQLINTTSPELSYLRPSLIPNLLLAVQKNSKVYDQFSLFDTGQTWNKSEQNSRYLNKQSFETTKLGIVSYKKAISDRKDDTLLEVKAMLQGIVDALGLQGELVYQATNYPCYHPKKQGSISFIPVKGGGPIVVGGSSIIIGTLAQLHPSVLETLKIESTAQVVVAELNLETIDELLNSQSYTFQTDGQYQTIQDQILSRDLCFVVDQSQEIGQIVDTIRTVAGVSKVNIFDLYQGEHLPEGKKSVALTLTICGDGTWTTDQINTVMNNAITEVEKIGGKLR